MKTVSIKPEEARAQRRWWVIDMDGKVLGRTASRVAGVLRGKHRPTYTPHVDTGDFVIVVNAEKLVLTGRKLAQKMYYRHSGYMGGLKSISAEKLLAKKPEDLILHAVKGMLPRGPLGRQMLRKLKVYAGPDHPHQAQQPEPLAFDLTNPRPGAR